MCFYEVNCATTFYSLAVFRTRLQHLVTTQLKLCCCFFLTAVCYFSGMRKEPTPLKYSKCWHTQDLFTRQYTGMQKFSCSDPSYLFCCIPREVLYYPESDSEVSVHTWLTLFLLWSFFQRSEMYTHISCFLIFSEVVLLNSIVPWLSLFSLWVLINNMPVQYFLSKS